MSSGGVRARPARRGHCLSSRRPLLDSKSHDLAEGCRSLSPTAEGLELAFMMAAYRDTDTMVAWRRPPACLSQPLRTRGFRARIPVTSTWWPSFPRRLGRLISFAALRHMRERGCRDAILDTDDDRLPAIRTYLALGFSPEMLEDDHSTRWRRAMAEVHAGGQGSDPAV
jgi:hypothetical protein